MPTFYYTAKSFEGETRKGVAQAKSKEDLIRELRKEGFIVTAVSTKNPARKGEIELPFIDKILGVSLQEKVVFTKNLHLMLKAGVGLGRAIHTLAAQAKNTEFRKALFEVETKVLKGSSLADALGARPDVFPEFFVSMVRVGEESGTLDESLVIVANQLRKEQELRRRVRGAMIYPSVIVVVMIIVGILMMMLVVPKLEEIFRDLKIELPLTTQIIIGVSAAIRRFWYLIPVAVIGLAVFVRAMLRSKRWKPILDALFMKAPILGGIVRKVQTARTARTLGSLIKSGVPIVRALEITAATLGNARYAAVLLGAREQVRKGAPLNEYFGQFPLLYPPVVTQMIQVGEETGNLTDILEEIAEFYEAEVAETTKNLSSIIEPVLMVIIGIGVGFFAVSMIQPMYSMLSGI